MSDYRPHSPEGSSLAEQLRAERARAARLEAELLIEQEKVRQLEKGFNYKDNEAWIKEQTITTLKTELRAITTLATQLQAHLLGGPAAPAPPALPAGAPHPPIDSLAAAPPPPASPAAQEADLALKVALLDLEERLQQAVALVLDEFNTRRAAEARIAELEAQLATVRRRIAGRESDGR